MNEIELLKRFPKQRPELPPAYRAIYEQEYLTNRQGETFMSSLAQRAENWMHVKVREGWNAQATAGARMLELGAGTLNHFRHEPLKGLDIVEPQEYLYRNSPHLSAIAHIYRDTGDISVSGCYGRIYSIAVLEHVVHLPLCIAQCCLLLADDGLFQAAIPSEGGLLWWLGWRMTTGLSYYRRNRLDYGVLMRHEHVNTAEEIRQVMSCFFREVRVRRFPLPALHMSLYSYLEAHGPLKEKASAYLAGATL